MAAAVKRFRLVSEPVPEQHLHEAVAKALDLLLLPPACWTTFPAGSVPLPPQFGEKLSRMGLKPGWPDILVLHGGRVHGIELKRRGGTLSKSRLVRSRRTGTLRLVEGQRDVFPRLAAGGMVGPVVCHSVDDVLAAVTGWGIPTRRAA